MKTQALLGTITLAIITLVLAPSMASAQRGNGRAGHRGGIAKAIERLNLTSDQMDKIKTIREGFRQQNATALQEIKGLREQAKEKRKNNDKDGARAIHEQLKQKREALRPAREQMRQQIEAILTPQQREELAKMKQERKDRRHERRGNRGESRPERSNPNSSAPGNGAID